MNNFIFFARLFRLTSDVVAVGGGTGTAAEDVGGEVVNLLAVLVTDDAATSGTSISSEYDSILNDSDIII